MSLKKLFSLVLCVAVVLVAACSTSCENSTSNKEIVIGMSGPLTGGAAIYGLAVENSAQMAVDEINANGGVNGYQLKLVAVDDKHDASQVSTGYATLLEKGMQVSLACVTTKPCLEFSKLSKEDNVFFITPSASSDLVPQYANGYQMCFADTKQGTFSANYVNENVAAGTKIGVLYRSGDDYSEGIKNNFMEIIDTTKFTNIAVASFSEDNPASLESQVEQLKDCTFIFLPIYYTPASTFMTQAKGKVANDAIYFGCDGLDGIDGIEGFDIKTIPQEVSYLSHFNSTATEGAAKTYIDKYVAAYGSGTLNQFGASAYDCVYVLAKAMEEAKITPEMSVSDTCEALKKVFNSSSFSFTGVTGDGKAMTWDSNGYVSKTAVKYVVKAASNA